MGKAATARRRTGEGGGIGPVTSRSLKPRAGAIGSLIGAGRIGFDEIRVIDEMRVAEATTVGRFLPGPIARANYRTFHEFWSIRAFFGDPTLRIIEKAVFEERPFSEIERDLGLSGNDGAAEMAFIRGLRSYAALAEWVDPELASLWLDEAKQTFRLRRLDRE
jgi:hypothetical protein